MSLDIGVVIPTHPNRMKNGMTSRALHSVMQQTYAPSEVHVYVDQRQRGAPFARQAALELNTCRWTAFLDSDDHFKPEHLQVLVDAQAATGADYVYSWYHLSVFGKVRNPQYEMNAEGVMHDGVFPSTHFTEPWDPINPRQTTITMLVRTDLAKSIGFWSPDDEERFPDGHRVGEDWHFTLECNRLGKIHHVPRRTWYWEHHGKNTSGRGDQGDAG